MVQVYSELAATAVGLLALASALKTSSPAAQVAVVTSDGLEEGDYYRPSANEVSGDPTDSSAPYLRTPCPALNTLANHGFVPRNGKNVTKIGLRDAVLKQFNMDLALADKLVAALPDTFDYNLLGMHGFIEHDASILHADAYFGADPSEINQPLLRDFLGRANASSPFTVETLGQIRKDRLAACKEKNPNCTFTTKESSISFGESALVIVGFGDRTTETAPYDRVRSFVEFEKFPDDFEIPSTVLTGAIVANATTKILTVATTL